MNNLLEFAKERGFIAQIRIAFLWKYTADECAALALKRGINCCVEEDEGGYSVVQDIAV